MDLNLKDKLFVVTGASSGFGKSIALALVNEGAHLIINARGEERLMAIAGEYPDQISYVEGDITTDAVISEIFRKVNGRFLDGIVINAGGPPAGSFLETEITDWDKAYESVLRWKVKIAKEALDVFLEQKYGRMIFIESVSVKQPVENLVLSNALRMAVVGMVKTLSQEVAAQGITANIIAPGYHDTSALDRLIKAKEKMGFSEDEARSIFEKATGVGYLGDPDDLGSLVAWMLSPKSKYITGQTLSIDGGVLKGVF